MKSNWSDPTDNFDAGDNLHGHDYPGRGKVMWADKRNAFFDACVAGSGGTVIEQSIEPIEEGNVARVLSAEDLKMLFESLS